MRLIFTITVSSSSVDRITFENIPQQFTDLQLIGGLRSQQSTTMANFFVWVNNNRTGYSWRTLEGNGSNTTTQNASSDSQMNIYQTVPAAQATSNTFGNLQIYIPNYAGSSNKSFSIEAVGENNGTTSGQTLVAGAWSNTAAINRVDISIDPQLMAIGSTISLYGITRA